MDWLSTENVIAIATALLGVLATFGALVYERTPRRRHIGYRVQMDTYFQDFQIASRPTDERGGSAQDDDSGAVRTATERLPVFNPELELTRPSLVLLRIENDGAHDIEVEDYTSPALRGLTARFTDRTVHGCAVVVGDGPNFYELREHLTHQQGQFRPEANKLYIPRVPLARGDHFKLVVLLSGGNAGGEVKVSGGLRRGKVSLNKAMAISLDSKPQQFSRPAKVLTGLLTLAVVALASLVVITGRDEGEKEAAAQLVCAEGKLTLTGSSAFAGVAEALRTAYQKQCPKAEITVDPDSSETGARALRNAGRDGDESAATTIAFTDGPMNMPELQGRTLSVAAFTLVVNDEVDLHNLSLRQVQDLFAGKTRNWNEIGGPNRPVVLVSRGSDSGTQGVFQRKVLGSVEEPARPEEYCDGQVERGGRAPERCELDDTGQVLSTVSTVPGAIGYTELHAATRKGLHKVSIDNRAPAIENIESSGYRFHEVEYAYTFGAPQPDSLTARFLNFIGVPGSVGEATLRNHSQLPCTQPQARKMCAPS